MSLALIDAILRLSTAVGSAGTLSDGLTADALPRVFELFWQAEAVTSRRHAGLGIGLSIVRRLVELHGGRVCAESAAPGQGATFTVLLPVATAGDVTHNVPAAHDALT